MSDDNYYKVGGSLEYQHPTYVVRKADSELYEGLTNGEFCYVLNSRQMGKSSLRVQMMKRLKEQGCKCASIDMTRIGSHVTPAEWYAGVVSELLRGFGLTRKINFSTWWREREALPPLQRLRELIEDVLLVEFDQNIVIFIDEIDSIIKIKFKEDFFAFIRACYNQRVDNSEYNRLTFCLLGVATPSDLIEDKNISTPFNIGRAIELTGFQLDEVQPLIQGLIEKVSNPIVLIGEVLKWTGGQPFLTQKLCKLILAGEQSIPESREARKVEEWVRSHILENWETQDEPEHLRTIRDRILWSQRKEQLLRLYLQILQKGEVQSQDKPEHMELRLSGLVVKQQGKLKVYNRIYASVFNQIWVENVLAEAGLLPDVTQTSAFSQSEIQALEQATTDALQQFETKEVEVLISAMQAGQALKALVRAGWSLQDYPTVSPLYALQTILDNIYEQNGFNAHRHGVNSVCFSPDGQYLATGGEDGTIELWNLYGQQIVKWRSHLTPVLSVSFSPDGQHIATSGLSGNIRLWDLSGQQLTQMHCYQRTVWSVSFSPDGKRLISVGEDGTVRVWKLLEQQLIQWETHNGASRSVSISRDGQCLATVGEQARIQLDLFMQQLAEWKQHQDWVTDISFSPNGKQIATLSRHNQSNLWYLSIEPLVQFNHYHYQPSLRRISFSLDKQSLAAAPQIRNLSGQQLAQLKAHQGSLRSISFSPDGQFLATAGLDGTVRLWDLSEKHLPQLKSHRGQIWSVCFSPDGQFLATAGLDGTVRLWDLSEKHLPQLKGHRGQIWSVCFSPDGQYLATASSDGTARLWNLAGQELAQLKGHHGSVWSVSFSPDGQYIVTIGSDSTARLWNLSGQQLAKLDGHQAWVNRVTFSPDGQRLATVGREGTARVWDLSGQLISQVTPHQGWVWNVSFSADGQLIATVGASATPPLLDASGRIIVQLKGYHGKLGSKSFSPDGQYLVTANLDDGTAHLWNLYGQQLAQLDGNQSWVISVSFSPDGQLIATAGEDGSICLWDLLGRQVSRFESNQGSIYGMSFSPDGKCLATAGRDGTVRRWRVEGLDELLARGYNWLNDYFITHPEAKEKLEGWQNKKKSSLDEDILSDRTATLEGQTTLLTHPNKVQTIQSQIPSELPATLEPEPNAEINSVEADRNLAEVGEVEGALADIQKSAQTSNPASKRILWVDDNPTNIAAELTQLNEKGIEVLEVHSINQAIEMLVSRGLSFDAIISDMARTENGEHRHNAGILLIQAVREAGFTLPIFIYSSMAGDRMSKAVVTAGGNGATRSVEALFAWLREYTNLAELVNVKSAPSPSSTSTAVICDRLNSERGIDYTRLRDLLATEQWLEADLETAAIMLKISKREAEGWLREEDIEKFPCTDLLTIDQLWVKCSKKRFGFSVQKEIWKSLGGKKNADYEIYCLFCKQVGWGERTGWREFSWLQSCDLTFNTTAPVGHLPGGMLDWLWSSYRESLLSSLIENSDSAAFRGWWNILSSIALRLEDCKMHTPVLTAVALQHLENKPFNQRAEGFLGEFLVYDKLVKIYQGDITNLVTDVIVSSDDNYLRMRGSVSHRIRQVGGDEIFLEAKKLTPLSLGEVAVTTAGNLRAKKIFHAVVIDFGDREELSNKIIQRVVHTCIKKANCYRFSSIAFPLLGTGAVGFPVRESWETLLNQIIRDLSEIDSSIDQVFIALYDKKNWFFST